MLKGNKIYLRSFTKEDAPFLLKLELENQAFFEKYSMARMEDFYTLDGQKERINYKREKQIEDQEYFYGIFLQENDELIGVINLFQVMRGSLQSAFIGYFLDKAHNGKGYTTEAVQLITENAFQELKLHRIEAGVMPHNIGSIRVLEKSGYHKEGIARSNVKINENWEDHQVLAIINPND
ncbi:GNAT family N-acetyltransferase [Radiobacillus kanasensis]|uniref:GNAT family N-acetyltransferase n=1 Tax=Radiobacillus kanasensis TaxID=2844358 RepID=UPI001E29AE8D|nr:GNAT family protein [Radiobacillus kanasensis]UFU00656.1 GNAT family N-acetyltransferase [Radiobacillus kanasensis]